MVNEFKLGLGLLQLVALMLPVLVILLDVIVNIRGSGGDPLQWEEFLWGRRSVYAIGVAGSLLVLFFLNILFNPVIGDLPGSNAHLLAIALIAIAVAFGFLLVAVREI